MSNGRVSTLTIQRAERPARYLGSGARQTGRVYADFIIDGAPLSARAQRCGDLISALGWGSRAWQDEAVARLLLEAPPDVPCGGGRTALYVCPEDGDLHCGTVTAVIERSGDHVVWRDFGFERGLDIDPPELDTHHLGDLGPFQFAWDAYQAAIRSGYGLDGFHASGTRADSPLRVWARRLRLR